MVFGAELSDMAFSIAGITHAVDLKSMSGRGKSVAASHVVFYALEFRREELDRTPTLGANHVVMAPTIVLVLVARDPIVKLDRGGKSALGKKFQCAVYGGEADFRVLLANETV